MSDQVIILEEVAEVITTATEGPQGPPGEGAISWNETPSGTIDGVNASFGLAHMPTSPDAVQVFHNGLLLRRGSANDYDIAEQSLTFNGGLQPIPGDWLLVTYAY